MYVTLYKVFFPSHDGRRAAWTAFSLALGPSGSSSSPLGCWFNCTLWSLFQEDRVSFINHWMWTWTFIYVSACQWCWFWRLAGIFRVGELSCMSCCFPLLKKKKTHEVKDVAFLFRFCRICYMRWSSWRAKWRRWKARRASTRGNYEARRYARAPNCFHVGHMWRVLLFISVTDSRYL